MPKIKPAAGSLAFFILALVLVLCPTVGRADDAKVRATVAKAIVTEDAEEQIKLIRSLTDVGGKQVGQLLQQWKEGGIFIYTNKGVKTPVTLAGDKDADGKQAAFLLADGSPLKDAEGKPMRVDSTDVDSADTDSNIRQAIKDVTDMAQLADPDPVQRLHAVQGVGLDQSLEKLPALEARLKVEADGAVKRALQEAIALTQLKSENVQDQIVACKKLGDLGSIPSQDALKGIMADAKAAGKNDLASAAQEALEAIASHLRWVNSIGTLFRGLSLGSILLVVAIGLAITFGLMGVINMAHGELIAVGAYTTYVVQGLFATGIVMQIPTFISTPITVRLSGMNLSGHALDSYFLLALPLSFIMAALVGVALERCIIRFLYRRPLESLLATWGVSLVLQQMFRLTFGANNVQVYSPGYLSGNWTIFDIILGWNRVFVIAFAVAIIFGTHLLLTKTPLGLLIRAVMQNRNMAACMGVRTQRVNMLTFAFGSGLAGLAGAFLSQIGNVGPSLGQSYIVDCFMTVVVGGVGNLIGTVISAIGIGVTDQSFQQFLGNPVVGKILVLVGIILFLQWRPAGIFVTKSRSLEG